MCSSGGPTRAYAPRTPGIVWHVPQPWWAISSRPRSGSPPVSVSARGSGLHAPSIVRRANRSALPKLFKLPPSFGDGHAPARFTEPRGEQTKSDQREQDAARDPHDQSRELLVIVSI